MSKMAELEIELREANALKEVIALHFDRYIEAMANDAEDPQVYNDAQSVKIGGDHIEMFRILSAW